MVKNCSSSLSDDAVCKKFGAHITETAVGEVNVALKMKELGSRIGGEGNGGIIFRDAHLGRDSICAICLVLSAMATSGKSIGEIVREIPQFEVVKDKYTYKQDNKPKLMQNIEKLCSSAQNHPDDYTLITVDGVKLLYERE